MRAYQAGPPSATKGAPRAGSELIARLDELLAAKLEGMLRSRRHHFIARRDGSHAVDLFLAHSNAAQAHADAIAARMVELGGDPDFSAILPKRDRAGSYPSDPALREMAEEDLEATRGTSQRLDALLAMGDVADRATRTLALAILEADKLRARELTALAAPAARRRSA